MWFKELTGFTEESPEQVRENLILDGEKLISKVTGESFSCGKLTTPSLGELRAELNSLEPSKGNLSVTELVADVKALHKDKSNAGTLFQVASQFNLLEMVSPDFSPESGVDGYEFDPTQGPACAIAAGAGTIYRNYFVKVTANGRRGQYANSQIDTLHDLGEALGNTHNRLWHMKNGYALATGKGLMYINQMLSQSDEPERDTLRQLLRIGLQQNTEVTLSSSKHTLNQAYCSALPVAYCESNSQLWKPLASLVLEASYEATLCMAMINQLNTGNNRVFLTMLGGGAFGNPSDWILNAIERALLLFNDTNLEVFIVSYSQSNHHLKKLVDRFNS